MFSADDCLKIWEQGAVLHAIDRALLILRSALPEADGAALARWPLGERDRCLLQLQGDNFGDRLNAWADCPACRERVEFSLSCAVLLAQTPKAAGPAKNIDLDDAFFELRCADSTDAAAMAVARDVESAVDIMLARCVRPLGAADEITPARRAAIAAELAALDPAAEMMLDLSCAACGHDWPMVFDIGHFLWQQIRARAHRLLQEVDVLARSYHWSEAEILRLSETRRAWYLEMALS